MCREKPETGPPLGASEHQRDCSEICFRCSLYVIFKMVYMDKRYLKNNHDEDVVEKRRNENCVKYKY